MDDLIDRAKDEVNGFREMYSRLEQKVVLEVDCPPAL